MTCAALLCAMLDISGTTVTLRPTEYPGAQAEIVMRNAFTNGPRDNAEHVLTMGDMVVLGQFAWDYGPYGSDALLVTPPDGMICIPRDCVLEVQEGLSGVLYLMPWEGM